jgi:hypothetical protein
VSDDVDTNAKRKEKSIDGLKNDDQSLCDKATILETKMKEAKNRKRKHIYVNYHFEPLQKMCTFHENSGGYKFHKHGSNNHHHHGHNNNGAYGGDNPKVQGVAVAQFDK